MSQDRLKNIIIKEINQVLHEAKKSLFVFDFDQTLVTDLGSTTEVEITRPIIHNEVMELLKKNMANSIILTARSNPDPVQKFFKSINTACPKIFAVGVKPFVNRSEEINAERKRACLDKIIEKYNFNYIEVWDDVELNLIAINALKEKYPNITLVTHLVDHSG